MKKKTTFFETMKKWRNIAGLSQEKAAEEIGVSRNTIQYWEGKGRPTVPKKEHFEKIIQAYKIDRDIFMKEVTKAISPTPVMDESSKEESDSKTALAQFIASTFYSLSPNSFNPVHVNICVPPKKVSISTWLRGINEAFCKAYHLEYMAQLIMQKAIDITLCICGVTELNHCGVLQETQEARENIKKVTLAKIYQVINCLKVGRRPGGASSGRGGNDNSANDAILMQWFIDGYNSLKESDVKNGWKPPVQRGNRPYMRPSPSQENIDMQFIEASKNTLDIIDSLLLAIYPYYVGALKEIFCCEDEAQRINIEEFMNGKAKVVIENDTFDAEEKQFFCNIIGKGMDTYQSLTIEKDSKEEKDEIISQAKEDILATAAWIKQKERAIQKASIAEVNTIIEQEARIKALTECIAELMKKCELSSLFDRVPVNIEGFKKEIENISTEALTSGQEFRIKLACALNGLTCNKHIKKNKNIEKGSSEQSKELSADELLSSAYEDFIQKQPEKGITMETDNFINKINEAVRGHVGTKTLEILNLDAEALETEEGIAKLTNWSDSIKKVVAYIGTTGNTRKALLDKELDGSITENIMKSIFPTCEEIGLLVKSASSGAGKGRPSPNYVLSYLGMIYFSMLSKEYTNGMPLRQARIMASSGWVDEKPVEHANLIHQMEDLLTEYGYDWKDEDEQRIPGTPNSSICDILATKDGSSVRIECELGNGNPAHYKEKVNKIFAVTPYALFIAPNKDATRSLSSQINDGLGVAKSVLKNKGQLWEVISFEEAKKKFKEDASWPIHKMKTLEDKKKGKKGVLSTITKFGTEW